MTLGHLPNQIHIQPISSVEISFRMLMLKFFLSVCIVLSGGRIDQLSGNSSANPGFAPRKVPKRIEMMNLGAEQNGPTLVMKPVSSPAGKTIFKIEAVENEVKEEVLIPSRKLFEISDYFTAFFDTQTPTHFLLYIKKSLPFYKHFSYNLSDGWHLACQALRV